MEESNYVLGLDISTKTIGIALFEDLGDRGELKLLHHVAPVVKPKPKSKLQELCDKANIFEDEFLNKYADIGISRVVIEEPLLRSNNVYTVATLLRFNGMICRSVYETLGVVPEFISSYDSRAYGFPELLEKRTVKKNGEPLSETAIKKSNPVLFGGYPYDVDKKSVIWEKVAELEPKVVWLYDKKKMLKKENYDMTDAYVCVLAKQRVDGLWKK